MGKAVGILVISVLLLVLFSGVVLTTILSVSMGSASSGTSGPPHYSDTSFFAC